jgi:hypothetical protein
MKRYQITLAGKLTIIVTHARIEAAASAVQQAPRAQILDGS